MARTPNSRQKDTRDAGTPPPPSSSSPSPSPRKVQSAGLQAPARGPLPLTSETSYHKRMRSILLEFKKCRKEWNELVIRGCVARCRAAIELWVDIETALKEIDEKKLGSSSQKRTLRAGYLLAQSTKLSEQVATVHAVVDSLAALLEAMNGLVARAEALVIEAATTRGTLFAFREPLWVTWPLSRFADGIATLSSHYSPSLDLVRQLIETLTTFPPLPGEDGIASGGKAPKRPKNEEIQAAMSLLAVQPLIPGKSGDGPEAWEELMNVEVGGYAT